jgi:dual specificity tyrosine-phosphorylation-regulated kinase 2/3/4
MDIWSFACIMAELATGRPLFAGEEEIHQLVLYMEMVGVPAPALLRNAARKRVFFEEDGTPRVEITRKRSLAKVTKLRDKDFLDLIERCLDWDQNRRITAADALQHPFFTAQEVIAVSTPRSRPRRSTSPASSPLRWPLKPRALKI